SNAADMLANMVSPPIAGTNFAHRIVAIGGLAAERFIRMPDVGGERRLVFVISEFDEDRCLLVVWGERMNSQFAEPPAEIDQIVGRDLLIAKDDQLVLDQSVLDHIECLV